MKLIVVALGAALVIASTLAVEAQAPQPTPPPTAPAPGAAPPAPGTTPPPAGTPSAPQSKWTEGQPCVTDKQEDITEELRSARHPAGPALVSSTYFLPAGAFAQLVLREPYKEGTHYFGYIERVGDEKLGRFLRLRRLESRKGTPWCSDSWPRRPTRC